MVTTNIEKARTYHRAVSSHDVGTVHGMIREDYIQHNPRVPTGRAAFVSLLPQLQKHDTRIENIRIFQDGSHVIMHHLWKNAAPFGADQKVAFHIIRFDQDGLIAEHWSVMTDLTPPNASGRTLIDGPRDVGPATAATEGNKRKVRELFQSIIETKPRGLQTTYSKFFHKDLLQHHPELADGIPSFSGAIENGTFTYHRQHKVFGSGDFVLSISEGARANLPFAFYDLFRLEDGLIAEHWNVSQEIPSEGLANENTMFNF